MHSGWLLLGFILAYVGPFRRYVGAKKFALKSKIFWCEKVGVGIAHVWPMLGQFGASWDHVEACWACVGWFGALMGSRINTNQASVRLGFVLGLCCLCWGSCWAKMACSFGWSCYSPNEHASLGHVEAMWGPCWQPSFFGKPECEEKL